MTAHHRKLSEAITVASLSAAQQQQQQQSVLLLLVVGMYRNSCSSTHPVRGKKWHA
jgi:hypothetical protein